MSLLQENLSTWNVQVLNIYKLAKINRKTQDGKDEHKLVDKGDKKKSAKMAQTNAQAIKVTNGLSPAYWERKRGARKEDWQTRHCSWELQ